MTRLVQWSSFAYVIVQGLFVSFYGIHSTLAGVSSLVSVASVVLSLLVVVRSAIAIRGPLLPPRRLAFIGAAGAGLRLVALPPTGLGLTWEGALFPAGRSLLAAGYCLLLVAFIGAVRDTARRLSIRSALVLSVCCGLGVWLLVNMAAFGPLPGVPTVLTSRDVLALWLTAADVMLAALAATVALGTLRFHNGLLSMPWLWIAYGIAVVAMGDSVQPLLKVEEASMFTGLLWGLGYLLVAVGFSVMRDSVEWNDSRRSEQPTLLVYQVSPSEDEESRFWDGLSARASAIDR